MKRHIAFMAFFASVACLAAPTANEDFVLAEDARTYTNAVNAAKEYTDTKTALIPLPDYTTNNVILTNTISKVAPAPGNYESVSNRAMLITVNPGALPYFDGQARYTYEAEHAEHADSATSASSAEELAKDGNTIFYDAELLRWAITDWMFYREPIAVLSEVAAAADAATNYTDNAIANIDIPDPDLSNYATRKYADDTATNAVAPVVAIVNSWESYWGGSNVVFEVTNYYGNTTGAKPRLRIREYRDEEWRTVWDEENKFADAESNIVNRVVETNAALRADLKNEFAPLAWGTVTDKGSPNPVTNTTFMTSPETYFAGGTEYQRVAVGSGTICVLVDKGALARTAGQPGTFRFQDDGGTNYFGFVKTDSYTIGCRTDGITVADGLVTLRYDVIMGGTDVPVVYWRENLREGSWVQLNNVDGTVAAGAPYTVTWYTSGGSYYAAINCTGNASGFFRGETSVMGDVVWETNMRARLGGGMECTNTATHVNGVIRPSYNGSSVTWTWSLK